MNEHVLQAVFRLNEAVTPPGIEPLNSADSHCSLPKMELPPLGSKRGSNFGTVREAGPALDYALGRASRTAGELTLRQISTPARFAARRSLLTADSIGGTAVMEVLVRVVTRDHWADVGGMGV
jgi:hypothetical protein